MALTKEQSLALYGTEAYTAWRETEAAADAATKGLTGSSSSSDETSFSFDWDAAKAAALEELAPYYEKLLSMYKGNVALAKAQLDRDYERGLRQKSETTAADIETINKEKSESARKYKIALNDLDQTLNSRGLINSGIRTTDRKNAAAAQSYEQGTLADQQTALSTALDYYKENSDAERTKQLEEWGMVKPTAADTTSKYAASNTGVNTTGFNLSDYVDSTTQYQTTLEKQKEEDAITKAENAYNKAVALWQTQVNQLNS